MQVHEKVEKSQPTVFFKCGFVGSKSTLAKAAGRSHLAWWEMKNCTLLWREAHLEIKMC